MFEILISIVLIGSGLTMSYAGDVIITQYDNCKQVLVFERPSGYESADMYLVFTDGVRTWRPHCIGHLNEFAIVSELTTRDMLAVQVFFVQDGAQMQYSDVLTFDLRPSVRPANWGPSALPPPEPGKHTHPPSDIVATPEDAGKYLVIGADGRGTLLYGGSSQGAIPETNFFDTEAARDAYFAENPDALGIGTLCVVDGTLCQYTSAGWIDCTYVVRGPQGDIGPVGETGPQGLTGEPGADGLNGDRGEIGPQGPVGPQGPAGPMGVSGPKGDKGDTGPVGPQGPQGVPGAQGAQGVPGPQGVPGEQGPQGVPGADGITGPAGPPGPAGNDGADGEPGPPGASGQPGPAGEAGPIGPPGPQGETGPIGPKGEKGDAGPQGASGPKGDKGDTGPAGPQGDIGPIGQQGIQGLTGPQGLQGPQGERGPQGIQGVPGEKGATGEKGAKGETGAEGPRGLPGPQGIQGPSGPTGPQGPQGEMGPEGPPGERGDVGPQGLRGEAGEQGPQGIGGPQGPIGPQGIQGEQGPMGPEGPQGLPGADGRSFVINGLYSSYEDMITDHQFGVPGDAWAVGSQESNTVYVWNDQEQTWQDIGGMQGPQGPEGAQGPQGMQGPAGPAGPEGPQGIQGIQGPQGLQGAKGDPGLTVSVNGIQQQGGNITLTARDVEAPNLINGKIDASQASEAVVVVTENRVLIASDAGRLLAINAETDTTITVPAYEAVGFPGDTEITFVQWGDGAIVFAPGDGVTIKSAEDAMKTAGAGYSAVLKRMNAFGENVWWLTGALE